MSADSALNLLVLASRVDPTLRAAVAEVEDELRVLRIITRRLLDDWTIGDNCDPDDVQTWAWERTRLAAPGSWLDEREPFEPGVDALLGSFDPSDNGGST